MQDSDIAFDSFEPETPQLKFSSLAIVGRFTKCNFSDYSTMSYISFPSLVPHQNFTFAARKSQHTYSE